MYYSCVWQPQINEHDDDRRNACVPCGEACVDGRVFKFHTQLTGENYNNIYIQEPVNSRVVEYPLTGSTSISVSMFTLTPIWGIGHRLRVRSIIILLQSKTRRHFDAQASTCIYASARSTDFTVNLTLTFQCTFPIDDMLFHSEVICRQVGKLSEIGSRIFLF